MAVLWRKYTGIRRVSGWGLDYYNVLAHHQSCMEELRLLKKTACCIEEETQQELENLKSTITNNNLSTKGNDSDNGSDTSLTRSEGTCCNHTKVDGGTSKNEMCNSFNKPIGAHNPAKASSSKSSFEIPPQGSPSTVKVGTLGVKIGEVQKLPQKKLSSTNNLDNNIRGTLKIFMIFRKDL